MSVHLVLLVLTVTSRLAVGSDQVLRSSRSADHQIQAAADANTVITSTETQGAVLGAEKESPTRRIELSSAPPPGGTAKESTSGQTIGKKRADYPSPPKEVPSKNAEQGASIQPPTLGTQSTTSRPTLPGQRSQNRDSKLMSLLAARRSALQQTRFRTHRRVVTTNRTTIETTSKSPSDPRSICERNCTKNFTRRTTASCMRRCVSMHRAGNITTTPSPSVRTKVDEKDNNEILFTDESSHGFFVVTKELNDTTNHISDGTKPSASSGEKNNKTKTKLRPPLSIEEVDMRPYVYFGQKLPPLKPTALKITKVSDEHPKILEVSSIVKPTERSKIRNRFNPRERNIIAYNRRHGLGNFTRQIVFTSTNKPVFGMLKGSSEEKFLKEAAQEDHSPITILARSPQAELSKLQMSTNNAEKIIEVTEPSSKIPQEFTPVTLILEDSTPLIISVIEGDETAEAQATDMSQATSNIHTSTSASSSPISMPANPADVKPFMSSTTKLFTMPTTSQTTSSSSSSSSSTTTTVKTTTPTSTPSATQEIFRRSSTATPDYSSTSEIYTKTTISSSIRTTTHPKDNGSTVPLPLSSTSSTSTTQKDNHDIQDNSEAANPSGDKNSTVSSPLDFVATSQDQNQSTNGGNEPEIEGVVLANNDVTMEMSRINTATYVLAGLGMFPVAIIILYVTRTLLLRRRLKHDDGLDNYITDQQPISPVRKMDSLEEEKSEQYSIISSYQEFDRKKLRFKSLLGEGNFGQVWKAEADDLSGHLGATRIVAVKTVRTGSSQAGLKEEAEIMRKLGSHPNVVTLLGACIETEPHLLIMEYAMRGRLLSLLRAARSATNILPASVPGGRSLAPLSPRTLAGFALDIARGMEYIAEKKIVHRDLAARNVLLDHNGVCKICDFGMSIDLEATKKTITPTRKAEVIRSPSCLEHRLRLDLGGRLTSHWNNVHNNNNNGNHEKKQHDSISKRPALPIRWMAPEALQYHIFSTETDVWAFGIVLWEIATLGCTPYPNLSGREVVRCVPNGTRPDLPKDGRPEFYDLMSRCWHKDPRQRPTFKESRIEISRTIYKWVDDDTANSDYMDVSGFSEDMEHGMVYFNRRISEFECDI